MDKLTKYKSIVRAIVQDIGNLTPPEEKVETLFIMDDNGGHYILFDVGWQNAHRIYLPWVHIDVKDSGRVWLQHDGTDLVIADMLEEKGIPKSDIVLAFQAPHRRAMIEEYAVN
ncbi:MAG: XisI protein [Bacteroidota bacterium]